MDHDAPHAMAGHEGHEGHMMPGHEGHTMPGHDAEAAACSMAMVWNTETKGMCIVHQAWHVQTEQGFAISLVLIFALGVGYEFLKLLGRQLEVAILHAETAHGLRSRRDLDEATLIRSRPSTRRVMPLNTEDLLDLDVTKRPPILSYIPSSLHTPQGLRGVSSVIYGIQVALSCFLMLVMMTYNAWLIGAIVVGAMVGSCGYVYTQCSVSLNV
ncbi:ctr copper transporter [Malassezia pachydermatis]|uniref:Copper transport protein n=1 Tax=Malassezia pachydermatis TaxID=77020 RepID=A0A0M8MQI4_9BASI|nr:ctr copper transporter [Malassezia pachydermatis]KOS16308.1 ctr copper transporter [Malassezia pachydermatis]